MGPSIYYPKRTCSFKLFTSPKKFNSFLMTIFSLIFELDYSYSGIPDYLVHVKIVCIRWIYFTTISLDDVV